MRIVFMGTPDFALPSLRALHAAGHEIAAVYTQPPRPAGRGHTRREPPVAELAKALALPLVQPESLRSPAAVEAFRALAPDAAVVVAYGQILPPSILAIPRRGCLNLHASLLPRWRGAAPIARAIMAGDCETGVSIMLMDEGLDTGPVLMTAKTPIGASETAGELHDRLAEMGASLLVEALAKLDTLVPRPQPETGASYAPKIDKAEARIDWTRPAAEVARTINALSPYPGAFTEWGGERIKILRARSVARESPATCPGEVLAGPGLVIACGEDAVEALMLQREGRRALDADAFLRGFMLPSGAILGEASH